MKVLTVNTRAAIALTVFAAGVVPQAPLHAQGIDPRCPAGSIAQIGAQDACQKAIDIFNFMAPQLGIGLVGGNATLGRAGALGGIGRFSIGIRGNAIQGRLPRVEDAGTVVSGAQQSDYELDDQVVGLPAVDAALGIFNGIPVGVTRTFALDALVSATYVPAFSQSSFDVSLPDGSLKLGFGGRLGLLEESIVTPSVAVTYLRRDLPRTSIVATSGDDRISLTGIELETAAWRAVVGKSLGFFGIALGGGQDKYDSRAQGAVSVSEGPFRAEGGPYDLSQSLTRTNLFVDFSLNFPFVKLAAEIGRVSGGKIETYNTFSGKRADDALTYASVGLRIGY